MDKILRIINKLKIKRRKAAIENSLPFEVKIYFRTEFPNFISYTKVFKPYSGNTNMANDTVKCIMENSILLVSEREIERFHNAFVSAKHMETVLTCKIINKKGERILVTEKLLISEIANQLFEKTKSQKKIAKKISMIDYILKLFNQSFQTFQMN